VIDVVVRGRNLRISAALRTLATEKVQRIERFTHDASRVEVDFEEVKSHHSAGFVCDITAHLKRHFVKASANASDPAAALDLALDKAQHQVARIKEKRVSRSHPRHRTNDHGGGNGESAGDDGSELDADEVGAPSADDAPIVKTKRFTVKPMGLEEAALQMELLGHDFFLFTNAENGHAAVLYRRRDGALGLIETTG
jgi:putative sigma-54 modulation protein